MIVVAAGVIGGFFSFYLLGYINAKDGLGEEGGEGKDKEMGVSWQ